MRRGLNYSGLMIAGLAFLLTRFTVTLAYQDTVQFYLAGIIPLAVGLGLAAFGVALAVADVDPRLVRRTAVWCLIGFGSMLVLVVLTLLGSPEYEGFDVATIRSKAVLSNFLIGGSVGGTLTGLYASRNRRQRGALRRQANRLVTLNRLLRHEILNAVTAIRGYANLNPDEHGDRMGVIDERAAHIQTTIEEVKYLTEGTGGGAATRIPVDLGEALRESVEVVAERHPDANVSLDGVPEDLGVYANEQLAHAFTHLLENAVVHAEDPTPSVAFETTPTAVSVSVADTGSGLPASQRALLETGDIDEFDDPQAGFGLNVVRLLVESYGGRIDTDVGPDGTTVTVELQRVAGVSDTRPTLSALTDVRPAVPHLMVTGVAALVAGVAYAAVSTLLGGSVSGIGVFYGTVDPVVGWLTHEFHSAVFAFVFAGLVSLAPERYRTHLPAHVAIGVGWGVVLWFFAAGVVSPVWLGLLGFDSSIPTLSVRLFWTHVAWGSTLGVLTALGYEYVTPALARLEDRYLPTL